MSSTAPPGAPRSTTPPASERPYVPPLATASTQTGAGPRRRWSPRATSSRQTHEPPAHIRRSTRCMPGCPPSPTRCSARWLTASKTWIAPDRGSLHIYLLPPTPLLPTLSGLRAETSIRCPTVRDDAHDQVSSNRPPGYGRAFGYTLSRHSYRCSEHRPAVQSPP